MAGIFDILPAAGDAIMNYLRWNLIGSPGGTPGEMGYGALNSVANAGRMMTTQPMQPPSGTSTDDSGRIGYAQGGQFIPLEKVDTQAARAYYGDQSSRGRLPAQMALGILGSGANFATRGALGMAGGRMTQAEMDAIRNARFENKLKNDPANPLSEDWLSNVNPPSKEYLAQRQAELAKSNEARLAETNTRIADEQAQRLAQAAQMGGSQGEHLAALIKAGTDQGQFNTALAALQADKSISKDVLTTISQTYGNHVSKGTKSQMLDQIEKAFIRDARFQNKIGAGVQPVNQTASDMTKHDLF